jgi:hypothetical protein
MAPWMTGEELPFARDALKRVYAALLEFNARAGDEVLDGARDEHLVGGSFRSDAGTGVDRDPRDFAVH